MTKKLITTNKQIETVEDYNEILRDIRSLLEKATYQAYKAVDNLRVQTYWQVGERIARGELEHRERADYGEKVIERLTVDINMQKSTLYDMLQFYKIYPIFHAVRGELAWTHFGQMNKYLNYYRENKMYPWEKSPVGLLVCEYKGKEEVHYALGGLENKIFVAEYKAKLPGEEEIGRGLKKIRSAELNRNET